MSIEKAYMHAEDAYIKLGYMLDRYRGMTMEKQEMESIQVDLFHTLQELSYMVDDGK